MHIDNVLNEQNWLMCTIIFEAAHYVYKKNLHVRNKQNVY